MLSKKLQHEAENLLLLADIKVNGTRPHDIKIHNDKFFQRVLTDGSLGLGESYVEGWWDCDGIDELFYHIFTSNVQEKVKPSMGLILSYLKYKIINMQNISRAFDVGKKHYDIGNDLYKYMLDDRLVYTCGYWKDATDLNQAQEAKLDLVCKKIGLEPGMKILDIGCGWGSFAKYAAEKYHAHVVGITVSQEQVKLGNELCKGLPVEIRFQDYRKLNEKFDHIVSLGMFEHVGYKNYRNYMKIANNCLKDNGVFLLHTIGSNVSYTCGDPWLLKYIFPNSMLPSIKQIGAAIEGLFIMEDWHNFSAHYDQTLKAWFNNFNKNWDSLKNNYDQKFYRMWSYYLLSCAGFFRSRKGQLWQIVLSKKGIPGSYVCHR